MEKKKKKVLKYLVILICLFVFFEYLTPFYRNIAIEYNYNGSRSDFLQVYSFLERRHPVFFKRKYGENITIFVMRNSQGVICTFHDINKNDPKSKEH
ncbi:MAG: hypothetical protein HYV28_20045 [Ignavibacteriales bacterium]|nr:hypothetical protein [Ignavibacteriales bacterium]